MDKSMERNARGNFIERSFYGFADRYLFDTKLCSSANGWEQYDTPQDAYYYGVWINREKRQIAVFAEGDFTLVTCPTAEGFEAEMAAMREFYGKGVFPK